MKKLHLDFETRSAVDLKAVGAWAYALHPSTQIVCIGSGMTPQNVTVLSGLERKFNWRWNGEWDGFDWAKGPVGAHSVHFEYAIYNLILHRQFGWPARWEPSLWSCTLSRAAMCGLPISLEKACAALGVDAQKDMDGRRAILRACKPIGVDPFSGEPRFDESPALHARVAEGCGNDVRSEMALDVSLPDLNDHERRIFELDLLVNRRGFQVDTKLAAAAANLAGSVTKDLNARLVALTGGAVDKATQVQGIKWWLESQGLEGVTSLDKAAVSGYLTDPDISQTVKDVLSIRSQVGKSSTAKYTATLKAACPDGRVRGGLQYHAAATGRWGGRLVQPQNYPKGVDEKKQAEAIATVMMEDFVPGGFVAKYGAAGMQTLSDILRGTIVAAPKKKLIVSDFVGIETRVLFWEADEVIGLTKLRNGENLYVDMARYVFKGKEVSKHGTPHEYAIGKFTVLGAGYGMGAPRFQAQCATAGVSIPMDMAETAIYAYREKYRSVVNCWYATERAAICAVKTPGSIQSAMGGKVAFSMSRDRRFLLCKLPSGRFLFYFKPSLKNIEGPRGPKEELHYLAPGLGGALEEQKTYGGSLVENITQAIARDLMANGMLNVEAAGFQIVLTSHDEIVSETDATGVTEEYEKLMCDTPAWAAGCPVTAEGWTGERYRK